MTNPSEQPDIGYPEVNWEHIKQHLQGAEAAQHAGLQAVNEVVEIVPIAPEHKFEAFKANPAHGLTATEIMRAKIEDKARGKAHAEHLKNYARNHNGQRPLPGSLGDPSNRSR